MDIQDRILSVQDGEQILSRELLEECQKYELTLMPDVAVKFCMDVIAAMVMANRNNYMSLDIRVSDTAEYEGYFITRAGHALNSANLIYEDDYVFQGDKYKLTCFAIGESRFIKGSTRRITSSANAFAQRVGIQFTTRSTELGCIVTRVR